MKKNVIYLRTIMVVCLIICVTGIRSIQVKAINYTPGELTITFLKVGQGDSMLLQSEGKTMLVDAGKSESGSTVTKYLQSQGITKLDYAVITHDHADHIGGFYNVLNSLSVDRIFHSGVRYTDADKASDIDTKVNQLILSKGITTQVPTLGQTMQFGSATIEFIGPYPGNYASYNNNSIVMRVVNGENSFFLAADAEAEEEAEMLKSGYTLKSDVLKVGHHSALTSSTQPFLDAVAPTISVICCDSASEAGFPRLGTLAKLTGTNIYRTDFCGDITMVSDGTNITVDQDPYFYANSDFNKSTGKISRTVVNESDLLGNTQVSSAYDDITLLDIDADEEYGLEIKKPLILTFSADAGVYKVDSIQYDLVEEGTTTDVDSLEWEDTKDGKVTLTDDFSGCVYVKFENQLGNTVIRKTTPFTLDCTAPTNEAITSNVNGLSLVAASASNTYQGYSTTNPTIKLSCDYGISGAGTIEYMLVNRGEAFDSTDAWTTGKSVTLKNDFIGRIYVRFTDAAGNKKTMKTTGFKWIKSGIANTAVKSASSNLSLINLSAKSSQTASLKSTNSTLTFSADFGYGGKKSIEYQLVKSGGKYYSTKNWVSANKVTLKKGFTGTVYVRFTDVAGHKVVRKTNLVKVK